ncbi:hypothetical protein [Glaciihabitans sp. dw_435]|uniref:hypothetical protein n=1 Tax=Glaciihabitans sp. dw_435 TaxID=2720081 RepID=UPI001BD278B6|nr:hypothetical protein [Glaciihabitans sp. dw_435]
MTNSYVSAGTLLLIAALTLSGCATEAAGTSSTTASPAPTESVTPLPSVPTVTTTPTTPAAEATRPAPDFLVVSTEGVGPLVIGSPVPAAPAASAVVAWDADYCVGADRPDVVAGGPFAGAWVPRYAKTATATSGTRFPFEMVTKGSKKDAPVTMIYVWSPLMSTTQGIHPGSTVTELTSAYGADATVKHFPMSDVYTVTGPTGRISFEVATKADTAGATLVGTVVWMTAYDVATEPFAMAGTDAGSLC